MRRTDPDDNTAVTEPEQRDGRGAGAATGPPAPGAPDGLDLFRPGTYRFYANLAAS